MRRTRDLMAAGTQHAMRAGSVSVIRGVRRDGTVEPVNERDVRNALEIAYPELVFAGWTAAALHGVDYTKGKPPEIWLPRQRSRKDVVIHHGDLPPEDVLIVAGRRATSAERTAVDLARFLPDDEAVAAVDQFLRRDRYGMSATTKEAIVAHLDAHPHLYGGTRARAVIEEARVGADSPWETFSRLVLHRSGLRLFETQVPVPGTAYHVDLGSAEHRIAIEYDGEYHGGTAQLRADIARWNRITGQRWALIRVTASMLTGDRVGFLRRVERELRGRGWRGPSPTVPQLHLLAWVGEELEATSDPEPAGDTPVFDRRIRVRSA